MKRGDTLQLTLENFAFEGKSVARVDGMVVFVHGGVPGDVVEARVVKTKKSFVEANVIQVVTPSGLRVAPRCAHFGPCGGCKWQHVAYDAQLDFKRQHVVDALERIGGFRGVQVSPTLGSDDVYCYRNKMEFSFGDRWLTDDEMQQSEINGRPSSFGLGLHIPGRYDKVLDLRECWLQSEESARILNAIRSFCLDHGLDIYNTRTHTGYLRNIVIRESKRTAERMINVVTSDDRAETMRAMTDFLLAQFSGITTVVNNITARLSQVAVGETEKVYHGSGFITERIGKCSYRVSANSFFQTNTAQGERLYDTALRMAELKPDDVVFDLYCGTGTIALHLAGYVRRVIGIEAVASSIADAERNAAANGVDNCTFHLGDLKDKLTADTTWLTPDVRPDVIIVDPPRAGMHEKVVKELVSLAPRRIVYVSCNPTTQARDLKILCDSQSYSIKDVQPVDMFPHTYHIENVVRLDRTV